MELEQLSKVVQQADILWDQQQLANIYEQMAGQISKDLSQTLPIVLCVMNGGLFLTAELIKRFNFPLELDYVHLSRYRGETTGGEIEWLRYPPEQIKDRTVLIIDDILDEGITLKILQEECRKIGAQVVKTAVLAIKQHNRRVAGVEAVVLGAAAAATGAAFCHQCGGKLPEAAKFCPACGTKVGG